MRIIKLDLPATYRSADPEISLVSDEIRKQLFKELERMDYEISEIHSPARLRLSATQLFSVRSHAVAAGEDGGQ